MVCGYQRRHIRAQVCLQCIWHWTKVNAKFPYEHFCSWECWNLAAEIKPNAIAFGWHVKWEAKQCQSSQQQHKIVPNAESSTRNEY